MYFLLFAIFVFFSAVATGLFLTRGRWSMPFDADSFRGLYSRLPGSFAEDIENGLSSDTFNLGTNVDAGDSRGGLDDASKKEILKIMKKRRMTFDQARKTYMESRFQANGIGADGVPRDPKFVSFS